MNLFDLPPNVFKLLFILRSFTNNVGECYPSQITLMNLLGTSKKPTLVRALEELKKCKLVSYQKYYTSAESINGKKYPKPYTKYSLASDFLSLTTKDYPYILNIQISAGKLPCGMYQKVTRRIVNNKKNPMLNTGDQVKTAKNSLIPLTKKERYEIALSHKVSPEEVARVESQVLNPENIYKYKHKTTYYTTEKWLDRRIDDGKLQTLDANGLLVLKTLGEGR